MTSSSGGYFLFEYWSVLIIGHICKNNKLLVAKILRQTWHLNLLHAIVVY